MLLDVYQSLVDGTFTMEKKMSTYLNTKKEK